MSCSESKNATKVVIPAAISGAACTRSKVEDALLALVRKARLPLPEVNARLLSYEVDFLWRGPQLVVEVDGMAFQASARAFVEDRR